MLGTPEASSGTEKILKSWGGGQIALIERFDAATNKQVQLVDILGVRLPRRSAESALPFFQGNEAMFKDLSFSEPEVRYLQAILMRQAIGHHGLFLGPPGLGKSRMAQFAAFLLNVPFHRIQCQKGMNVTKSLLWTYVPTANGGWAERLGPLPVAMQEGAILLVDEFPNLEPADRQALLEPTERPNKPAIHAKIPTLTLGDFPGGKTIIEAAEGFFILATGNYHEGQGVGEIHPSSKREERRIRSFMLDELPKHVRPNRAVGRWFGPKATVALNGLKRVTYYENGSSYLTEETATLIAHLFQAVEDTLETELGNVKQEPPVYLTEAMERAVDHFMTFQVKKAASSGSQTAVEHRTQEVIESAIAALEFYFVNSFRENTRMRVPTDLQSTYAVEAKKADGSSELENDGRTSVKAYIKWKIRKIIAGSEVTVGSTKAAFTTHLKQTLESGVALQQQKEQINKCVDAQYPLAVTLLQKLIHPEAVPTLAKVKESLAHLSNGELKTFLDMKKPMLLLRPVVAPQKYRATFDAQIPGKRAEKPDVNAVWDSQSTGALEFETVLVEGSDDPGIAAGDNPSETLAQRRSKNEANLLDIESYYLLVMRSHQAKAPIDTNSETILSIEANEKIALGSFKNGLVDISLKKTAFAQAGARFRKAIRKPIA